PTRLLDLESGNTTDGIRLLETAFASLPTPVHYAALSYCEEPKHAADVQLSTTPDTYSAHPEGISACSITRSLQDAITKTRALSIRYLWVDALCIIQGDLNDWMRES
ncbi:HET-domain-containing protein, partial [Lentithecium fluviatile CBS 122367]